MDNCAKINNIVKEEGIVFFTSCTFLSQTMICAFANELELETSQNCIHLGKSVNIIMVFIELAQNMMKYSNMLKDQKNPLHPNGLLYVRKDENGDYHIHSQNFIESSAKKIIGERLKEITSLDKELIVQKYKKLRRNGIVESDGGAGIGLYEIAKNSDNMSYSILDKSDSKYELKIQVMIKKEKR